MRSSYVMRTPDLCRSPCGGMQVFSFCCTHPGPVGALYTFFLGGSPFILVVARKVCTFVWQVTGQVSVNGSHRQRRSKFSGQSCRLGLWLSAHFLSSVLEAGPSMYYSVVQWLPFSFSHFSFAGPTKLVFPKKGSKSFFPGSLNN